MSTVELHQPSASSSANTTPHRSTRGASKQRRDQINVEIQRMRDLLPLSDSIKDRLFQLQVMSLACIFIRKHRYKPHVVDNSPLLDQLPCSSTDGLKGVDTGKALRGFLLMATKSGKMLYLSENASEYLGHSVEEIMCQGDSLYDMVDSRDHTTIQTELGSGPQAEGTLPEDRIFICRMNLSRTAKRQLQFHKFVLLHGRYIHPSDYYTGLTSPIIQPIFAAFCQPLLNPENAELIATGNTNAFTSQHFLDMKFREMDSMFLHHFGYSHEDLMDKSWYSLIHPDNVADVAYKHRLLCQEKEGSVLSLIRMETSMGEWLWVHSVLSVRANYTQEVLDGRRLRHVIHVAYQIVSEQEAAALQSHSWIYSMRHSYPTSFTSQDSPDSLNGDRPITPASPFLGDQFCGQEQPMQIGQGGLLSHEFPLVVKQEPGYPQPPMIQTQHNYPMNCGQIKVEIPCKLPFPAPLCLYTPENSSPESSSSFPSHYNQMMKQHMEKDGTFLDGVSDFINTVHKETLPELRDVDEFFKQEEYASSSGSQQSPHDPSPMFFGSTVLPMTAPPVMEPHPGTQFQANGNFFRFMDRPFPPSGMFHPQGIGGVPDTQNPTVHRHNLHRHSIQYGYPTGNQYMDPFFSRKRLGSWAGV